MVRGLIFRQRRYERLIMLEQKRHAPHVVLAAFASVGGIDGFIELRVGFWRFPVRDD